MLSMAGLLAQPSVGKSTIALGPQYHFVTASYTQTYAFTDILGNPQHGTGIGSKTSNTIAPYFSMTGSLLNFGKKGFYFGDYIGFSMAIGATSHNYELMGEKTKDRSAYAHFGLLGGLSLGYEFSKDFDLGIRGFYDFRWLVFYVGADEVSNIAPFPLNWSVVGRYKQIQGDFILGGYSGYLNSEDDIKTYSINLRYLYGKKEDNYIGTRLDLYRNREDPTISTNLTAMGVGIFWGYLY